MCCGASRRAGKLPTNSYLLGDESDEPARFVRVLDPSVLPVQKGTVYVRGTGVQQALDDGLLEPAHVLRQQRQSTKTIFRVTLRDGSVEDFDQYQQARLYSTREGGQISVVKE